MTVTYVLISDLKPYDRNPRTITKSQFEKLCNNIASDPDFFSMRPILVNKCDEGLVVYAGNQRLKAAEKLGLNKVPCIIAENIPLDILKKRIVLDNITHGEFDYDLLATEFEMEELLDLGMDPQDLDIFEADDEDTDKEEKKKKVCPHCGGDL